MPLPVATNGRAVLGLLALLTLATAVLRFAGLDALLAHQLEPDSYSVLQAEYFQEKSAWKAAGEQGPEPRPERHFYYYPMLLGRLVQAQGVNQPADAPIDAANLGGHLAAAGRPIVRGRWVSAFAMLLLVPATFLLARRFLGPWRALLAAAFAATCLLAAVYGAQARPHALVLGTTAWALLAALRLRRAATPWNYLLAGLAAGLAVCSLQNGAPVLLACAAAALLRDPRGARGGPWKVLVALGALAGLVLLCYPILIEPAPEGTQQSYAGARVDGDTFDGFGHRIYLENFGAASLARLPKVVFGYDPVLCIAALLGLAVALGSWRRATPAQRRDGLVIAAHAVPYAAVLVWYAKTFDRYALPLVPVLSVLAAAGAGAAISRATRAVRERGRAPAVALGVALVLALPTAAVVHLARLRRAPDTYELATTWLDRRITREPARVVTGPMVVLPLLHGTRNAASALRCAGSNRWLRYEAGLPEHEGHDIYALDLRPGSADAGHFLDEDDALAYLRALDAEFVVIENSQRARSFRPQFRTLRRALARAGRAALVVEPRADAADPEREFLDWGDARGMLRRVLTADHLGPRVEVWRLSPAGGGRDRRERGG